MGINEKDFVELTYTGKLKEGGFIFDTTDQKVAQENGVYDPNTTYGPVIVCVGQKHIIKGIDSDIIGKELGKYQLDIPAEEGFGKKDAKLVQLIQTSKFKKQGINPMKGLQVNVDGVIGTIKAVSGGRTLVDFNHPLSGQDLHYEYEVKRIVTDDKEKVKALLSIKLGKAAKTSYNDGNVTIKFDHELPEEVRKKITENIKELVPSVKEVKYEV